MVSHLHPTLYRTAVAFHQSRRHLVWMLDRSLSHTRQMSSLPVRLFKHQSPLIRKLGNVDLRLQHNKVNNLQIAAACLDGVLIRPGETLSLWRMIGKPTAERGFMEGLLISHGKPTQGVGGGLCQLANLLHWMYLHTPLVVTERHHHSIDLFPDSGRTIPFGTGATIFYNYFDLQVHNPTDRTFQLRVWVEGEYLRGEVRADRDVSQRYSLIERDHAFERDVDGTFWRTNKIFREVRETATGRVLGEEHLMTNRSRVAYEPSEIRES
jgi:vancomycin resistance protein VanW